MSQTPAAVISTVRAWARAEAAWLGRAARYWPPYALLLTSLLLWIAAWQAPAPVVINLGGPGDDAYVRSDHTGEQYGPATFYAKEPANNPHPPFTYRWSQPHSRLVIPGLGARPITVTLRLAGARPPETQLPPPVITATIRGQQFTLQTTPDLADYPLAVGRGDAAADLVIRLDSPTFTPANDQRSLGVLVERVTVEPADASWTIPPLAHLAFWLATLALIYLVLFRLLGAALGAALVAGLGAILLAAGLVWARPDIGFLAPDAPVLAAWGYILVVFGIALARLLSPQSSVLSPRWVAGAFAAGFLLRFGGMVYPQFLSSDLGLHIHNLQKVLAGIWVFPGALPNGTVVPYPPVVYMLLAPLAAIVPDSALVLRWGASLLDAATAFPLVYIARRLGGTGPALAGVAWASALLPAAFVYFSAGNYSNLIAQAIFAWALAPWVVLLVGRSDQKTTKTRNIFVVLCCFALGLTLTFLGHYGMLIAAFGIVVATVVPPLLFGPQAARRQAAWVLAGLVAALALAFALYYGQWLPEMRDQAAQVLSGGGRRNDGFDLGSLLLGTVRRLGTEWGGVLGLGGLAGLPAILIAQAAGGRRWLVTSWIGGALVVGAVFAALEQTVGDSIRYPLLLAPWIALGAGRFWGLLARRGRAGPLFVAVLALAAAWHLLTVWLRLIFTQYH